MSPDVRKARCGNCFGVPVYKADAVVGRRGFEGGGEIVEVLLLSVGGLGPLEGGKADLVGEGFPGVAGFGEDHVFTTEGDGVDEILFQKVEGIVPGGVEAEAEDVVVGGVDFEFAEEIFGHAFEATAVDVDDDADGVLGGLGFADGFAAGVDKLGKMIPVEVFSAGWDIEDLALWPEHAGGDFVSDLDPVGRGAVGGEGFEDVGGVVVNFLAEVVEIEVLPLLGGELLAGVGPGVGIVDVEEEEGAGALDAAGQAADVIEVLDGAVGFGVGGVGVDEEADAEEVAAAGAHDL